ncbi:hypothetical protein SSX86_010617 [Deinandra increscens subsp. villosa]|uniref:Replication factor A C-terminal domain-containing protein n=1 Tax=Deinandra increscens subsp. villosa TaxID=3103831 RepID=A0AAP0DCV1_9ASTR
MKLEESGRDQGQARNIKGRSFFKVVRFPERPYLHIPSHAFSRYLYSRPVVYKINLLLRDDLRYVVRLRQIDNELYITKGWPALQRDADIRIKYIVVFKIQDLNTWSVTILGDNGVGLDLLDIPLNLDIPVDLSDGEDDVIIPPPASDEEDQIDDDDVPAVPAFSQKVKINKKVSYKVPPPLAVLADLASRMILNIKVEDQDVHAVDVLKEDKDLYDSITDLELSNNNHNLKVKILKTWKRPVFNDPKHTYSLEFVCADEQGNRAQGSCLASFFYRFERFLEEQNVLTIKKPLLGSNGGSWTVINSPLKICFNRESQLALSPQWSGSRHSFSFTDFKTIIDCQASLKCSIDIIGMLIDCSPIKRKMKNDVETSWVLIQLQDLSGEKIWVTLFDEYAYKITEFLLANPGLAGTARHTVSNAFSNSNLFINDSDIEEITTFLDRFSETEDGQSSSTYKSGSLSVMISKEEDFLDVTDFMYSAQVADITEPKTVVVLGTIKKVNNQWFYMACNHCLRKVESQLEPLKVTEGEPGSPREVVTYYCKNPACNDTKKVIQAYPRYMVLLKVQDSTGTVDLTLFDSEAKKTIKKTALEVHDNYTPDPKLKLGTDDSDFLSTQNTSEKEVISICDDNVTPSSISNIAKLNADERESKQLKRNLDDSFENQELLTMSSAKKQSSSSNSELSSKGEFDGIVDGKLLIPKKEK